MWKCYTLDTMIKKISSQDRHYKDFGSLKTYWLFSFSNYRDPENMDFGSLRVFNDDIIMPKGGFPDHPHDTMEIMTIVLSGTLSHKDSMGNIETIQAGEVQRMSAGEGIIHSEFNNHDEPVHLYQLWFYPNKKTTSDYEQKKIENNDSRFTVLASSNQSDGLMLHANATISWLNLKSQESFIFEADNTKGYFLYVTEGALKINDELFIQGDQARITDESEIKFFSENNSKVLFIEVTI